MTGDDRGMAGKIRKWRGLDKTLVDVRAEFSDLAPEDLQDLINEAIEAVRNEAPEEKHEQNTRGRNN